MPFADCTVFGKKGTKFLAVQSPGIRRFLNFILRLQDLIAASEMTVKFFLLNIFIDHFAHSLENVTEFVH